MGPQDDIACCSPLSPSVLCPPRATCMLLNGCRETRSSSTASLDSSVFTMDSDSSVCLSSCSASLSSMDDLSSPRGDVTPPSPRSILKRRPSESSRKRRSLTFHPSVVLWTAVQQGNFSELQRLLESHDAKNSAEMGSLEVNRANHQGITPLHLCCFAGASECVRLLLENGAFPNRADNDGWTPVHAAAIGGHVRCLRLLHQSGADLEHKDRFGRTPAAVTDNAAAKSFLREMVESSKNSKKCTSL